MMGNSMPVGGLSDLDGDQVLFTQNSDDNGQGDMSG